MFKSTAMWAWAMFNVMRTYKLSHEQLAAETSRKLNRILIAAHQTPYYQRMMRELDYDPIHDFRGPEDLKLFPILTKEIIKEHGESAFIVAGTDLSQYFTDATSGSTGMPLRIWRDPWARALQIAKWLRVLFINGYSVFDKTLSLTSPARLTEGQSILQNIGLFQRHPIDYLLPPQEMINELIAYQPNVLYGNRSHLDLICDELQRNGQTFPLKLLLVGAEVIRDQNRRIYKECFKTNPIETYGSVELGIMAFNTPNQNGMTLCEDQSYFEFLDDDGISVAPGNQARLIVTDLANTLMPFIRYDQGDKVIQAVNDINSEAGWKRLERIIGRDDDFAILSNGKRTPFHVFYEVMDKYENIKRFRIVQKTKNKFEIHVQANLDYIRSIETDMLNRFLEHFPSNTEFLIIETDLLEPDKHGKFRMLISEVK